MHVGLKYNKRWNISYVILDKMNNGMFIATDLEFYM